MELGIVKGHHIGGVVCCPVYDAVFLRWRLPTSWENLFAGRMGVVRDYLGSEGFRAISCLGDAHCPDRSSS
jgi:hypothetical protein